MKFEQLNASSSTPLYLQLSDIFKRKIIGKEILVGQKFPNHRELCIMFKVSENTLNEAISTLKKEGLISARPRHGMFVINAEPKKAAGLIAHKGICLLVFPGSPSSAYRDDFSHPQGARVLRGIDERVKEKNAYLIYRTFNDAGEEISFGAKEKEIAGAIVVGQAPLKAINMLKKSGIPFVAIGDVTAKKNTDGKIDVISDDDYQAAYLAVRHLAGLGHRNIVFLADSFSGEYFKTERLRGYKQALKESGITFDNSLLLAAGKYSQENGCRAIKKLLEKPRRASFTAILVIGNQLSMGAIRAMGDKGLMVPGDISMVVHGDLPGFTRITKDYEEVGRAAFDRLVERIADPGLEPKRIVMPYKLIAGTSTRSSHA
ncbi:MAG: hypothetical protein A2297_06370 [Elusimicrobia bacterium RIFOXYB2_FULL_48_7]|nr:MAG: hypothetical protein A2297_06370 [Elusimicrobia bacterium RIFOXYB2_FULL_48_7]